MYDQIIVPLDGSELSAAILEDAEALARKLDAGIVLLQVTDAPAQLMPETAAVTAPELSVEVARQREHNEAESAQHYLQQVAEGLQSDGLRVETRTEQGEPSRAILEVARQLPGSVIAMTTHGRSGLGRMFYGSVAEDVLKHSPVPVLLKRVEE